MDIRTLQALSNPFARGRSPGSWHARISPRVCTDLSTLHDVRYRLSFSSMRGIEGSTAAAMVLRMVQGKAEGRRWLVGENSGVEAGTKGPPALL
ncbi:hypothetical protein CC1G_15322 [Coprinopsis cinerea okayama7|uniref:Uncharacterized protein n=1 Tax=Coprinopsis cinerea (strain Okayama-7 / 130 / ATCC MYA-4618 / FGSC 9003) TaxID=240176 RepID=D6RQ01_COPC7|nr:hypothetical protein CC1G_15322 [Coprinopsis cinerea okayama7\|eukprot:XP_002910415.1 hypothetical protein CC1G_15322 [Coprinopsis cinerea okayama7\